jgi:serine/threonine-protein kinase
MTAPFTRDTALAAIGTIVGSYELVELVGTGGMGAVYRAIDRRTGATVAVKVFGPSVIEAGALARFYQEARLHRSLVHQNIAKFIGLDSTAERRPCLVMEFVEGASLADLLAARGPFDVLTALRLVANVAAAAAVAHAHGIVHRDIKASNVRLATDGTAKLLDFGIAKPRGATALTAPGNVIGTPRYLSPEQLLGGEATPSSDVWAIGVLLYELTTGRVPFDDGTPADVWRSVSAGDYPTPSRFGAAGGRAADMSAWREVDAIVAACLVRDARKRQITATAIAERALRAAAGQVRRRPFMRPASRTLAIGSVAAVIIVVAAFLFARPASTDDPGRTVHHIDVVDGRAAVIVNGRRAGRTPLNYTGRIGDVINVDLEMDGYETLHEQIQLGVEGTSTFALRALNVTDRRDK